MISSMLSFLNCRVQYMSLVERYSIGVRKSKMKKGPTFAFSQKCFSSKNLSKENSFREAVKDDASFCARPSGNGLQKSRFDANRSDICRHVATATKHQV